ncbi:hypothetical protein ACP70R_000710 [Stipagrostis hirtigluma subsp. patula]
MASLPGRTAGDLLHAVVPLLTSAFPPPSPASLFAASSSASPHISFASSLFVWVYGSAAGTPPPDSGLPLVLPRRCDAAGRRRAGEGSWQCVLPRGSGVRTSA